MKTRSWTETTVNKKCTRNHERKRTTYIPHVEGAVGDAEVGVGQMVAAVAAAATVHRCHPVKEALGF